MSPSRFGIGCLAISVLPLLASATSYSYTLQDTYAGDSFYDGFTFFTDPDPTHGFVQYVDQATAVSSGILGYGQGTAKWGVDSTNVISNSSSGRQSVRLEGKVNYNHGLFLADIKHMPGSICGVWPAFWTLGNSTWPAHGEMDIIEGVNMQNYNQFAAHTAPNCTMSFQGQTGWPNGNDCAVSTGGAAGCAVGSSIANDYGDNFNTNGGGIYAMQWTSEFMKLWFFPRNSIPASISSGSPDVSDFGTPTANFDGGSCDIDSHFINHRMIFDTTFCGDWAGGVYSSTTCPMASSGNSGCVNYVAGNPGDFAEAYWEVNSIKVYAEQIVSSSSSSMSSTSSLSSSATSAVSVTSVSLSASTTTSSASSTSPVTSRSFSSISSFPASSSSASSARSSSSSQSSSSRPSSSSSSARTSTTPSSSSIRTTSTSSTPSTSIKTSTTSSVKPTTSSTRPTTSSTSIKSSSSSKATTSSSSKATTTSSSTTRKSSSSASSSKPTSSSSTKLSATLSTRQAGVVITSTKSAGSSSVKTTSTSKTTSTASSKAGTTKRGVSVSSKRATSTSKKTTSTSKKTTSTSKKTTSTSKKTTSTSKKTTSTSKKTTSTKKPTSTLKTSVKRSTSSSSKRLTTTTKRA